MRRSKVIAPSGTPVIDGFTDLVAIGSGGFSMVYRAHELALDRAVAVKVLNTGLTSERERRDFERECKALGQLNHPDVVTVYRPAFTDDGRPCIVMALYERNFRDQLDATGPLPPAELLDVGIRMAVALHVAHRRGVLHRDVKPHNIFRSVYGDPALGDFGISTLAGERSHDRSTALSLAYVAPEILDDAAPSAQADVYSLAATLHHLATGRAPFDGKEPSPRRRPGAPRRAAAARPQRPPGELRAGAANGDGQGPGEASCRRPGLRRDAARGPGPRRPVADAVEAGHRRGRATVAPVVLRDDGVASTGVREGRERRPPPTPATPIETPAAVNLCRPPPLAADRRPVHRRPAASRPPPPEPVEEGPSRRRWVIATALAVVAIAAVVIAIVVAGGGSSPTAATTTVASSRPPDTFFTPLAPPTGVTVTRRRQRHVHGRHPGRERARSATRSSRRTAATSSRSSRPGSRRRSSATARRRCASSSVRVGNDGRLEPRRRPVLLRLTGCTRPQAATARTTLVPPPGRQARGDGPVGPPRTGHSRR